jgi:hypothetical protein
VCLELMSDLVSSEASMSALGCRLKRFRINLTVTGSSIANNRSYDRTRVTASNHP